MLDWLTPHKNDWNGFTEYHLDEIREKYDVRDICEDGYLVLGTKPDKDGYWWLKFAVFAYAGFDMDKTNVLLTLQLYGEGPTTGLRECRHTYWGEEGYLFYPNGPVIMAGFKALSEFYDGMV